MYFLAIMILLSMSCVLTVMVLVTHHRGHLYEEVGNVTLNTYSSVALIAFIFTYR